MKKIFNTIQQTKLPKNQFDLTHEKKLSCNIGEIIPILNMDVVPGDVVDLQNNVLVRFAPLIAPIMHRVDVYVHHFYVPNRLLWDDFENFITGGEDGNQNPVWPHTNYSPSVVGRGTLADYLGLPVSGDQLGSPTTKVSMIPFAAYAKIYNDYYRDQNLQNEVNDQLVSGLQPLTGRNRVLKRAWEHDYFTSALPWTQKGPEAMLPLGTEAPVTAYKDPTKGAQGVFDASNFTPAQNATLSTGATPVGPGIGQPLISPTGSASVLSIDLMDSHYADLSQATASSIIELRRAFKLQEWLELNARAGTRYTEFIHAHFGVISSDKRLQRAEYIGGSKNPVTISEVLQTSSTDNTTPQANMAGHAVTVGGSQKYSYYVEEHGYIMSMLSVMPKTSYQQGIPRHFLRSDRFDYYFKQFEHIGEQAIDQRELIVTDSNENGDQVFGYIPRYSEYKYIPSSVAGDFKASLDFWHMTRKFAAPPELNSDFIECDWEEVNRVFAVEEGQKLWIQSLNMVQARRPMAVYSTPKM